MKQSCPVCENTRTNLLVTRSKVPVLQNALYTSRAEAVVARTGELAILSCLECGFVWNAEYDPTIISYSTSYENCQSCSPTFRDHLQDRLSRIASQLPAERPVTIVEVGCGQGDFLGDLVRRLDPAKIKAAFGFDPAWRGRDGEGPSGARIYRHFFDKTCAETLGIVPDVIISRHTIEHVPDPVSFLKSIRSAAPADHAAKLFLETPCNYWIRKHSATHDFFYEHCSIFDVSSLARALHASRFTCTRIERVFGDQYLWAEADIEIDEGSNGFPGREQARTALWRTTLGMAREQGKVAVWGAGAKGTTFLTLIDPEARLVDCVVDVNPRKQGCFLPGTGHPIVAPKEAASRDIDTIVIMNPNYAEEVLQEASSLGWSPNHLVLD